ncbi:hypothetical protein Tco_1227452 [Tanacetum coccineum]
MKGLGPVWGCDRLVSRAKVIENQVMAAPVISISSDSSEESVGSHALRVILFGTIPTSILVISVIPEVPIAPADLIVAPEVGAVFVISPTGVLDLVADSESEPAEQRPERHESLTPSSEFPLAPRRVSHRSSDRHSSPNFTSDSSSSGSSSDSLSDSSPVHSSVRLLCIGSHTEDGIDMDVEVATSDIREDEEEFEAEANAGGTMGIAVDPLATGDISEPTGGDAYHLEGTLYDMSHYMFEVSLDRITELDCLRDVGGRENLRVRALLCIERDRVDRLRRHMALSQEEFRQVCRDHDDTRMRLRRQSKNSLTKEWKKRWLLMRQSEAESQSQNGSDGDNGNGGNGNGGNGNGGNGNGGNGNPNDNDRGTRPVARECTYQDFMKCQPLNFKGTEGVVGLIRTDAAFAMSWRELMKLMAEVYCPRNEIQKMESEL